MIWVWREGASALTVTADETSNVVQALVGILVGWKLRSQASQPSCDCVTT
jgi:hypothetical protein